MRSSLSSGQASLSRSSSSSGGVRAAIHPERSLPSRTEGGRRHLSRSPVSVLTPTRNACTGPMSEPAAPPRARAAGRPQVGSRGSAPRSSRARPSALPLTLTESRSVASGPIGPHSMACPKRSRRLSALFPGTGRSARSWLSLRRARWSEWSLSSKAGLTAFRLGPSPPSRTADPLRR
jgi:hypothetical protein